MLSAVSATSKPTLYKNPDGTLMVHPLPQIVRSSLLPLRLPCVLLSPPLLPSPLIFPPANREALLPLSTAPLFLFYSVSIFFHPLFLFFVGLSTRPWIGV